MKDIGKLIYTANDTYEAGTVTEALRGAGIPSYTKELGAGQVFKVYTGFSNCGVEIYVPEESAEEAKAIVEALKAEAPENVEEPGEADNTEETEEASEEDNTRKEDL